MAVKTLSERNLMIESLAFECFKETRRVLGFDWLWQHHPSAGAEYCALCEKWYSGWGSFEEHVGNNLEEHMVWIWANERL